VTRLRAVIVDDEPLSRRAMRQLLDARGDVEVIAELDDASAVVEQAASAEVVFLDIMMPGRSGLDVARSIRGAEPPLIVFVSAFDEFGVPAFETEAVDYLTKPVSPERLDKAISRVQDRLRAHALVARDNEESGTLTRLMTRVGDRDVIIPVEEIDCIEADGVYAAVSAGDRRHLVRSSLDALESALPRPAFVRVHRSWIIPRDRVALVRKSSAGGHREIVMRSGVVVPVSRRRQSEVMRLLRG
jgi:two-component system LytT family response regulator